MPRAVPLISAFNRGELTPLMRSRVDLDIYQRATARMENMIPLAQGPATRRPGTRHIARAKADAAVLLIEFEFSAVQAYVIEAGPNVFRFFRNGALIETSPGVAYEVATPYSAADLAGLQWAQSADVLYLAHPNHAPRKLSRTGHTAWTLAAIAFTATPAEWTGTNYPACVTFFQSRLWWAGTPGQPQTIWGSKTGDFENLTTGAPADSALKLTIDDDQMNAIRWLRAQRVLLIGTASGEFALSGGSSGEPVTPSSLQCIRQGSIGSGPVGATSIGNSVIFVQRARRKIMEIAYAFDADGYVGGELSLMAGHLLRAGVARMAWQQEPWRVLWLVMLDGTLVGMTFMKDQQVVGFHRHPIGGTGVKVLSAACIPGIGATELWLLVERTIAGGTRRYVERMEPEFWADDGDARPTLGAVFMDSAITYAGVPASAIAGLDHLEGQTVQVLADGAAHPGRVVSGGAITLQRPASRVAVGLRADALVRTLDLSVGAQDGTAQTRHRRVNEVGVVLHQSMGFEIGYMDDRSGAEVTDLVETRRPATPMDAPPPLVSGPLVAMVPSDHQRECRLVVRSSQPLPLTLVALAPRVQGA